MRECAVEGEEEIVFPPPGLPPTTAPTRGPDPPKVPGIFLRTSLTSAVPQRPRFTCFLTLTYELPEG